MFTEDNLATNRITSDDAVIGLPMTLVVIIIVSSIIFSLYAVGTDFLIIFHQEQQIKASISQVYEKLSIMQSHDYEECAVTLDLRFPSLVETVVFGYDSLQIPDDPDNISMIKRSFITVLYKNGHQRVFRSSFAFCDPDLDPLIFYSGSTHVHFSMKAYKGEVIAIGIIK